MRAHRVHFAGDVGFEICQHADELVLRHCIGERGIIFRNDALTYHHLEPGDFGKKFLMLTVDRARCTPDLDFFRKR